MLVQTRGDEVGVGGPARSTTSYGYDSLNRLVTATERDNRRQYERVLGLRL